MNSTTARTDTTLPRVILVIEDNRGDVPDSFCETARDHLKAWVKGPRTKIVRKTLAEMRWLWDGFSHTHDSGDDPAELDRFFADWRSRLMSEVGGQVCYVVLTQHIHQNDLVEAPLSASVLQTAIGRWVAEGDQLVFLDYDPDDPTCPDY